MKQETFRRELSDATPDVPEVFHRRVETFLQEKVDQELQSRATEKSVRTVGRRFSSRALIFAIVAVLALGTVAVAATQWGIFDALKEMLGAPPPTADSVMQADLHQETVNGVVITVKEAGYDGRTLFLQYSYRLPEVSEPMGRLDDRTGERLLTDEAFALLDEHQVGWWIDAFWVNGQQMEMAANSGGNEQGSDVPGEIVRTEYWRLDNIDTALTGEVEIALPIGERQPLSEYSLREHPEKYDADLNLLKPDKGLVTFTFDAKDTLSRVVKTTPNLATVTPDVTAKVTEAAFTPLMTYITLALEPNPDSLAAYKAEHGEGWLDEEGNLLWAYDGSDVYGGWVSSLQLVDGNGKPLFPGWSGINGCGEDWAEFTYPYVDPAAMPQELWLAFMDGKNADMEHAIRVK